MEQQGEEHADDQREAGEDIPAGGPVAYQIAVIPLAVVVHNLAGSQGADGGTDAVGHHHEQSLGRRLDGRLTLLVDEDASRDVEEVEGDTVDDAGEDEHDDAGHGRIADAEEAEAEHPGEHRHEHDHLDA